MVQPVQKRSADSSATEEYFPLNATWSSCKDHKSFLMNNKISTCCFLFLHMLVISSYYVFPVKRVILYYSYHGCCFVQLVDDEETWMDGLRKEPLNVSVDLDEESSALA